MTKMTFNGRNVFFAECTAAAASIGSNELQPATYIAELAESGEKIEFVYFGVVAADADEAAELYAEADGSSYSDDLATVTFADGTTPRDYALN